MPGLAHFCEHLLFMVCTVIVAVVSLLRPVQGTQQFPKENEYSEVYPLILDATYYALKPLVSSIYPRIMALQRRTLHHRIPTITFACPPLHSRVLSRGLRAFFIALYLRHPVPIGSSTPSIQSIRRTIRQTVGEFSSLTKLSPRKVTLGASLAPETATR